MGESFDAIVVGGGPTGALAARTASEAGARVLLIERGPGPGATGPSAGVIRPAPGGTPTLDPALAERPTVEHRLLVLDEAASLSFDFRDLSLARGPNPPVAVRSPVVSDAWAAAARARGARVITGATDVRLVSNAAGTTTGVSIAGGAFDAPVTVVTEPMDVRGLPGGASVIEETFQLAARSVENRFQLRSGQGTVVEALLGFLPPTWTGRGWILTHREHLTLGVALHASPGNEAPTRLESAFERFRTHPAVQGLTQGAERVDRRHYDVAGSSPRRALAAPGLLRTGTAIGLGDPVGVFAPGLAAALASGRAAGESIAAHGTPGSSGRDAPTDYLGRLKQVGILALLDRARAHPIPLGWGGPERQRYARVLSKTFHELLSETGAPKERVGRTLRRVRRTSALSTFTLASDAFGLGRNL